MKKIKVEPRQSIFDLAIQEYGNAELFFEIILENNLINITDDLQGKELILPNLNKEKLVMKILNNKKIVTL